MSTTRKEFLKLTGLAIVGAAFPADMLPAKAAAKKTSPSRQIKSAFDPKTAAWDIE